MKRILFSVLISIFTLAGIGWSQIGGREVFYAKTFTNDGIKDTISIIGTGIVNHKIFWTGAGTITSCSLKVEQSADTITWTDLITGIGCTTDGSTTATGYANYVRVNILALTGSATLHVVYDGTPQSVGVLSIDPSGNVIPSPSYGLGIGAQVYIGAVVAGVTNTGDITVMPVATGSYNWVSSVQIVNTSSTGTYGYICNGTCATAGNRVAYFFAPPGASYVNMVPFRASVSTAVCVAAASGVTTLYASARGYVEAY